MRRAVGRLQCGSCLESSDAQNAQRVSLATPPKLWQALKVDIFELENSHRKCFFALQMDAACKLSSCSCFLEGNPRQRLSRTVRLSFPTSRPIGCSITHSSSFLISDPGGCFVSNELREWASVRSIGLLTAPGGLTAHLENLIRVIRRLARKLADDHPELTLASCVSLACSSHNNGFMTGKYSPVRWASGDNDEKHSCTSTMPSEIETFQLSAMNRNLQE